MQGVGCIGTAYKQYILYTLQLKCHASVVPDSATNLVTISLSNIIDDVAVPLRHYIYYNN